MQYKKEIKIGIFFIISIILLYWGVNFLQGKNILFKTKDYFVVYNNSNDLQVSNSIFINGVLVGRIKHIKLLQEKQNKILVTLEVSSEILIYENSQAVLEDVNLLGGKKINILLKKSDKILENGDTIQGVIKKSISEFLSEKTLPVLLHLDSTLYLITKLLHGFENSGNNTNKLLKNANMSFIELTNFIYSLEKSKKILVESSNNMINNTDTTRRKLDRLLDDTNKMVKSINRVGVDSVMISFNSTMKKINTTLNKLEKGSMGKLFMKDSTYINISKVLVDLDSLLTDIKSSPKKYVHFSLFGKKK